MAWPVPSRMTPSLTLTTLVTAITKPYLPLQVPSTCRGVAHILRLRRYLHAYRAIQTGADE